MTKRVTIMIDDSHQKKVRSIQAKMITSSTNSISFSHALGLVLAEGLKKFKI